jgi:hypothetical protein
MSDVINNKMHINVYNKTNIHDNEKKKYSIKYHCPNNLNYLLINLQDMAYYEYSIGSSYGFDISKFIH